MSTLIKIIIIILIFAVLFLLGLAFKKYVYERMTVIPRWEKEMKKIKLSEDDRNIIQRNDMYFKVDDFWSLVKCLNIDPKSKLEILHSNLKFDFGKKSDEYPEQLLSIRYIKPLNRVLEIGGNIGRNSCIIASLLQDSKNLVVLESHPKHIKELEHNRNQNKLSFAIEPNALSARPLIQKEWDTKPLVGTGIPEGWEKISTINYASLIKKYKIKFDTLVLDCEGAFYYILLDFPEILNDIQLIIMENNFETAEKGAWVHSTLEKNGFEKIESQPNPTANSIFKNDFHQVWRRIVPFRQIVHLVLYSEDLQYDKMYQLTRKYYAQYPGIKTIYYKFSKHISKPYELKEDILHIKGEETYIPGILEKTIKCFEWVQETFPPGSFDYVIRSNISTIVNFDVLLPLMQRAPVEYGGSYIIHTLDYISGTCVIFSENAFTRMMNKKQLFDMNEIDDRSFGKLFAEHINECLPMTEFPNHFVFVPDCKGDENMLKQHVDIPRYAFYRNRSNEKDDRSVDVRQMRFILQQLRPDLFK